jgi:aminodeoxyfutalosine deaminase
VHAGGLLGDEQGLADLAVGSSLRHEGQDLAFPSGQPVGRRVPSGTLSWLRGLPKAELHVHLEGSLTSSTIGELAVRHGRSTAAIWPQGLPERLCFDGFADFVRQYIFGLSLLRSGEDLYTVVLALAENLAAHQVRYAEVTTTAFLHHHHGMPMSEYADGLNRGRREAARRGVEISWVVDIPREMEPPASMWSVDFLESGAAPDGVVALGLGGHEPGFPAEWFVDSFRRGLALGLGSVPHAGETMGPSSVAAALDSLGAHRLGHGVRCIEDEALLRRIVEDEVMLEVCPTSNILLGVAPSIDDHPIQRLIEVGATFSINTDDPGYFATDLSTELHLIHCHHHIDRQGLREAQRRALAHSYAPDEVRRRVSAEIGEHALHDKSC